MKTNLCSLVLMSATFLCVNVHGQNWVNGGNTLLANGTLGTNSNHSLIFETAGLERARLTNAGNWGIGTSSPVGKFQVRGNSSFGSSVTAANAIRTVNLVDVNAVMRVLRVHATSAPAIELMSRGTADGANVAYWEFSAEPSDKSFRLRDKVGGGAGIERVTVKNNGYVGIGTTGPSTQLHVVGKGRFTNGLSVDNAGISSSNSTGIGVQGYGNTSSGTGVYGSGYYGLYGSGVSYGVYGTGGSYGVYASSNFTGVYGTGTTYGLRGVSSGGWGVWGQSTSSLGVYGSSSSNYGVYGSSGTYPALYGTSTSHYGMEAHSSASWGATAYGVSGVYGQGTSSYGVYGTSNSGVGGYFYSATSYGIRAATGRADKNWAGIFDGNVYAFGAYQTSDKNLKKNIEDLSDAISIINKLKPRSYEFRNDGKLSSLHLPQGKHYGFIAQDLEEILPNLVKEVDAAVTEDNNSLPKPSRGIDPGATEPVLNSTSTEIPQPIAQNNQASEKMTIKSINYIEIIPLLVRGMQEQDKRMDKQEAENNDLRKEIAALRQLISESKNNPASVSSTGAYLEQNLPNPARGTTLIRYRVPEGTSSARLTLINAKGQQLKSVSLTNRGAGQVNLDTASLPAGIYHYSLLADGKELATKQLVIAR